MGWRRFRRGRSPRRTGGQMGDPMPPRFFPLTSSSRGRNTATTPSPNKRREAEDAETALVWVMEQSLTKIQERYDARLEEMAKPAKEQSALMEQGSLIGDQMDSMREWTYENSVDPIYPELHDSDAYEEIAQVVVAMHGKGLPLSFFQTPEGINQAVLTWRDWRARNKRPWSSA